MKTTTKIHIDLLTPGQRLRVHAVQDDICTREVLISLYSGGASWTVPSSVSPAVGYRKPDGTVGLYDTLPDGSSAVSISGNTVAVILAAQMLTSAGTVEAAVTLADAAGNQLSTFAFDVIVAANPGSGAVKSKDYFNYVSPMIQAVIEKAAAATTAANEAAFRANAASELAEEAYDLADTANQKVDTLRQVVSQLHSNIVEEAAGQVITLSDSAEAPFQGLKVFGRTEQRTTTGKNLFAVSSIVAKGSYTAMDKTEDSIRIYSTDAAGTYHGIGSDSITLTAGTTYTVSLNVDAYVSGSVRFGFRLTSNSQFVSGASKSGITATGAYSFTYSPSENIEAYLSILVTWSTEGDMGDATFSEIQIEVGPEATGYEPYTGGMPSPNPDYPQALESVGDGGTVNTMIRRRNWIPYPYRSSDGYSANGLTFRVREDGSVVINGTATAETFFYFAAASAPETLVYLPAGTYTFSGVSGGTFGGRLRPQLWVRSLYNDIRFAVYAEGKTFTITEPDHFAISIDIVEGNTLTDFVVKPMLNAGETALPYEPPAAPQTLSVATPNGLPGIPVTSGGNYTDENGQQYIANYRDWGRGVDVQMVGEYVFTGDETWEASDMGHLQCPLHSVKNLKKDETWGWCEFAKYQYSYYGTGMFLFSLSEMTACFAVMSTGLVSSAGLTLENISELTTGKRVLYMLATPIETPIPEDELAAYAALHTNYPNTTILNDAGAYMEVEYIADTKMYVDNQFAQLAAALLNNT